MVAARGTVGPARGRGFVVKKLYTSVRQRESSDNPKLNAFCRVAPSVRFNFLAIRPVGVFLRAIVFSSRTCTDVQARLLIHFSFESCRFPPPQKKIRRTSTIESGFALLQGASKLMKSMRFPPGWVGAVMEASRRYRHYSPLLAHK